MRRNIIFLMAFVSVFAMSARAYAASQLANLDATVGVNSVFTLSASLSSLNFGNKDPDITTATIDLYLFCETNDNNEWELSIEVLSPLTSGADTILNENFNWWGWGGTLTGWDAGTGHLNTNPHTFYTADPSEYITPFPAPLSFTLQFNIDIPAGQAAGLYTTSIVVKMRDTATSKEVEEIVYVTVGVNPVFAISVAPSSLTFSEAPPGATTETKGLYVACSTNNNESWSVNMRVVSELTSETYIIPNKNFHWAQGDMAGGGTWDAGTGHLETAAHTFYTAGAAEWITLSPVELTLRFYIVIPPDQTAGMYTTTIIFTITEGG